jgi:hypothetical protein
VASPRIRTSRQLSSASARASREVLAASSFAPRRTQRAVREVGYAVSGSGSDWWSIGSLDDETTPELRWPYCIPVYDAMRKQDAQVGSVLRAVTHPVRSTRWWLDPNGATEEVVAHVSRDLGIPVIGQESMPGRTKNRFSWPFHLRHALLSLPFGAMYFEQVYWIDEVTDLAHLRKLGPRMPRSIARFNVARDGGLISIEQRADLSASSSVTIPVSRLVAYVNEREGGNWAGLSLLRTAYKNWLLKDRVLRTQTSSIDRQGMGIPIYTAGENAQQDEIDSGEQLAVDARAGDNAGAAIRNGAKFELVGVTGQIPDTMAPIKYHDEQIARAVLAHFLNLGTQTGSWALGTTFADFFTQSLQAVAQDIADVTTAHVIEDLVDLNWGPDEPAPRLVFDEIGSNKAAMALAIKTLVDAGVITPDEALEAYTRLALKLPPQNGDPTS